MEARHDGDPTGERASLQFFIVQQRFAFPASTQRLNETPHAQDDVHDMLDLALLGDRQPSDCFRAKDVERVAAEHQVGQAMLDAVAGEDQRTRLLGQFVRRLDTAQPHGDRLRPEDGLLEGDVGTRPEREIAALLSDGNCGASETLAVGKPMEDGAEADAQAGAGVCGRFGQAMRDRQLCEPTGDHLVQVRVREVRGHSELHHDAHDRCRVGIVHERQLSQTLDRTIAQRAAHDSVLGLHIGGRRTLRKPLPKQLETLKCTAHDEVDLAAHHLKHHSQYVCLGAVDTRARAQK